jgi:hemerythrin superfamily protein
MDMLTAHDDAEHGALYPLAATLVSDASVLDRSLEAHSALKRQMDHVKALEGIPLVASFQVLRDLVTAHVEDEEQNLLPALRQAATEEQLDTLGARILQAKLRGG